MIFHTYVPYRPLLLNAAYRRDSRSRACAFVQHFCAPKNPCVRTYLAPLFRIPRMRMSTKMNQRSRLQTRFTLAYCLSLHWDLHANSVASRSDPIASTRAYLRAESVLDAGRTFLHIHINVRRPFKGLIDGRERGTQIP